MKGGWTQESRTTLPDTSDGITVSPDALHCPSLPSASCRLDPQVAEGQL